jgi:hypothetical protein
MIGAWLAVLALGLAGLPAALFLLTLRRFRAPAATPPPPGTCVSILIPARDEEARIEAAVKAVLASEGVAFEVLVLDDHSTDRTAERVAALARRDARVRLLHAPDLPPGWCGKMHACAVLAEAAAFDRLLFLDADVVLEPDAVARSVAFLDRGGIDLAGGFPHERTGTLGEALLVPMIHFLLLGFLPLGRMRSSRRAAYAAGCGQLFLARRAAYVRAGGHRAIRRSLHDGLTLPRAFRRAGLRTDIFDATPLASCRMYHGWREVWRGAVKNAVEGVASPRRILPFTVLLLGGQVLPFGLLGAAAAGAGSRAGAAVAAAAVGLAYAPRFLAAVRFRQSWLGALLHPVGVVLFLAAQWYALARHQLGRPVAWRGRAYPSREPPHEPD